MTDSKKTGGKDNASVACPYCGAQTAGAHFCPACEHVLPVAAGADFFSFFNLPRRLRLDEAGLEKSFYALSRRLHPDYFMGASAEERQASVERSSMLNDAYRTLRNAVARAGYLLRLEGYKEAEKKAPPELLEEVFELNMNIEELKAAKKMGDEEELAEARQSLAEALDGLNEKLGEIDRRLFALFDEWDAALGRGAAEDKRAALDRMSELLSHRSYIRNLVRDIKEEI
ncbi:MAG TPA: Fe-S protein assembly co-chaperone HscB [Blastocatellia bacterium]|nr:Fe-S protein assembly co-chaperone HscB [Blastocatellia bacterium]